MSHDAFPSLLNGSPDPADDPRFTAYALGEPLDPTDRAVVEQRLARDPAARALVADLRATAEELKTAFVLEVADVALTAAAPAIASETRSPLPSPVISPSEPVGHAGAPGSRFPRSASRRSRSWWAGLSYAAAGLAAAAFVLLLVADYREVSTQVQAPSVAAASAPVAVAPRTLPPEFADEPLMALEAPGDGAAAADGAQAYVTLGSLAPHEVLAARAMAPATTDGSLTGEAITTPPVAPGLSVFLGDAVQPGVLPPVPALVRPAVVGGAELLAASEARFGNTDAASLVTVPAWNGAQLPSPIQRAPAGAFLPASTEVSRSPAATTGFASSGQISADARGARTFAVAGGELAEGEVVTLDSFMVSSAPDRAMSAGGAQAGSRHRAFPVGGSSATDFAGATPLGSLGQARVALDPPGANRPPAIVRTTLLPSAEVPSAVAAEEAYAFTPESPFERVMDQPLSTFSVDVDTASFTNVRRFLTAGQRPPRDAVRLEELVNYFSYAYAPPVGTDAETGRAPAPFAAHLEVASAPWAPEHRLVRIALKGREVAAAARPPANLVFLLDVSGSMAAPNKLPLVRESLRLLVGQLRPDDRIALVVYAGASGLALPSTPVAQRAEILAALEALTPGGGTNGALGLHLAYDIAKANFIPAGANRVILCTDGDFNVGVTAEGDLVRLIEDKARSGVFLTVLGFGMGNLKDRTLELLADRGNGAYGYIDTRREAEKLLVAQVQGTLLTIAQDVKLQVEFNPATVAAYRLLGYDNRRLRPEDFANDRIDAGEIGAGHTVTAFYEVVPVGAPGAAELVAAVPATEALKYQRPAGAEMAATDTAGAAELLTVKLRYKRPGAAESQRLEFPLRDGGQAFAAASEDFRFAASVAAFGLLLRDSAYARELTFAQIGAWAAAAQGMDREGYRAEFLSLVERAEGLPR